MWCIAALCGIPCLILGKSQYVEYDGYWHVFIAQQNDWGRFWHDIAVNAHPPLFFLLLKGMLVFGHSLLIYRSISIVTGILSVYIVGMIARKITGSNVRGYQAALAYGLALPSIIVACEVRSYMLSAFFILWSFYYFLDIIQSREQAGNTTTARFYFAILACLACLSHYYAFFYCSAALFALLARYMVPQSKSGITDWLSSATADIATGLPIIVVIFGLYSVHAKTLAGIQGHLVPYYFDASGGESVRMFLFRNWKNFVNLFLPFPMTGNGAVALLIAGLASGAIVVMSRMENDKSDRAATFWTLALTGLIIIQLAMLGVAGKYPFGGDLRQQYLAFPFLVITGAIIVEYVAVRVGNALPRVVGGLANAAVIIAVVAVSFITFQQHPRFTGKLLSERVDKFRTTVPAPRAVYLDQYNLISFFISYDDWNWSYVPINAAPGIDVYKLRRDGQEMLVLRDTLEWNVDVEQPNVYEKLAASLRVTGIGDAAVFAFRQPESKPALANPAAVAQSVPALASKAGICPVRLLVTATEWYGDFQAPACSPTQPAVAAH